MFENGGLGGALRDAGPAAAGLVALDPRTGAWVSFYPGELPDGDADVALDVLPDGVLDDELTALLDDHAREPAPVEDTPAGPGLARMLADTDVAGVSTYGLVEAVAGWARLIAWAQAGQAAAVAELTTRPELRPEECGYRSVNPVSNTAVEVAARTVMTVRQAENLVGQAVQLVRDFPATHQALAGGVIDERRTRVITAELGGQDKDVRARVEAAVLPVAGMLDSVALRRRIQRLLHELAPVQTGQRCREARQRREVTVTPAPDAMAYVEAFLPAEDAMAVKTVLDAAASTLKRRDRAAGRPARTAAQCRADALAALAWAALDTQQIGPSPQLAPGPQAGPDAGVDPDANPVPHPNPVPRADVDGIVHAVRHRPGCSCTCDRVPGNRRAWSGVPESGAVAGRPAEPNPPGAPPPPALDASGPPPGGAGAAPGKPTAAARSAPSDADAGTPGAVEGPPPPGEAGVSLPGMAGPSSWSREMGVIPLASAQGRAVAVQVTFPFSSLAGLTDEPAHLDGYGPIPAPIARHLAAAGVWQWVGTDPASGRYVDHGHTRYRPTQALIEQVVLRDRTCRAPGCHRPAARCDIDHVVAHRVGGPTAACNCQALCRTHHLLKHRGRWRVRQQPDGTTVWTSPTGHTYHKPPEPIAQAATQRTEPATDHNTTGAGDHADEAPDPDDTPPY